MPHFPAPYRLPLTSDDPNEVMRRAITYAFAIAPLYRRADGGAVEGYAGGGSALKKAVGLAESIIGHADRTKLDYRDVTKRIPQLTEAAQGLGETVSPADYQALVDAHKPVKPWESVPAPATHEEMLGALREKQKPLLGMGSSIEEGTPVGLRLDIPAYRDHGVWIPTIHPRGGSGVLAHEPVARVTDAELSMPQAKALAVARGVAKSPFAKIEGDWKPVDQDEALRLADEALTHPDWRQVGMDPERHSYFYDRATQEPITHAEDVLQVGPLVLAKKPVYGSRDDFHYARGGEADMIQDKYPPHYMPGVGRQVMADGGAPVSAPITGKHTITAQDLIGVAAPSGQNIGAYTDAGGQQIAAPFVSSMSGGYPVYNIPKPETPTAPPKRFDLKALMQRIYGQRFGYGYGGDVEGEVDLAPGHTQLPEITVGHPHVEEALRHVRLPDMTVGHTRPNYDRGETMKAYEPTSWERAAQWMMGQKSPSPERRQFVEGLMGTSGLGDEKTSLPNTAHMVASFYPPTMGAAATLSAVELAEKIANSGKLEASDILSLVPTGAAALASGAASVFGGEHHHDAAHDVLSRMRQHKGGGGTALFRRFGNDAILRAAKIAREAGAGTELGNKIGVYHSLDADRIPEMVKRFEGAIPGPSLALAKPSAVPAEEFGTATLIGRPHLAVPDEHNHVFGGDAYTPRTPQIRKDPEAQEYIHGPNNTPLPPTVDNIVAAMKARRLIGGEGDDLGDTSIGMLRALATPPFKTLEEIQRARGNLVRQFDPEDPEWSDARMEAKMRGTGWHKYLPEARKEKAKSYPEDYYLRAATDYLRGNKDWNAVKYYYPTIPDTASYDLERYLNQVRRLKPSYFEAKQLRPVGLDEFAGAVLPSNGYGHQAAKSLVDAGVPEKGVKFYDTVDPDTRFRAFREFGDEFFSEGGEVNGYKSGGSALIENALKLARGYKDPASNYIADWKWRPLRDVQRDVGVSEVPEHVQNFGRFMSDISDKAGTEGLDPEDLIKAYMITRSSIQREGRTPAKLASYGIPVRDPSADLVRPEGQMADFLASSDGVRFLNEARKGDLSQDVVDAAMRVMKPFGMAKAEPDAMDWARRNLVEQTPLVSDMVARARAGASDPSEWRAFTEGVRGVGPAKSGFLASLLGRGDMPTLDARQAILHTGLKNAEVQGIMGMKGGKVGHEAVDRLAARQRAMDLQLPEQLDPFYQHLAHHTVWDAVGNEQTTHQDIIDAMKPRADGGRVGYEDGGVVDRALSFLSQFNPVGTAEAAPRPLVKAIMSAADKARQIASSPKFDREAFHAAVKQADADAIAAPSVVTTGRDVLAKNPNIDPNISLSTAGVPFAEHSYEWSPTGLLLPKKESDLAGLVRDRALITPALGDISPAETVIKNVGGLQLPEPTFTHGGGPYQRSRHAMGPNPAAWASRDAEANKMYNKILENAQAEGRADPRFKDSPIIMSHTTMGYPSVDSTHIVRHNVLGQIDALQQAGKIDPNEVERFDAFMRKKLGDGWPGMLNTDAVEQYLASNGSATSVFVQGLDNKGRLRAGFPDVGAARFAAMHPKLMGADPMASGYSMAILDPSKGTTGVWHGPSAETVHPTYGTRIPSLGYIGGTKYQVPFELMFPDWASRQKSHYFEKKSGTLKPITPTMLQQSMMTQKPVQRATQEWLDNIMAHVEKEKKPWGWKRGGRTRIHF